MNSKLVGGILLIVGTTIGAGMLALPMATAEVGFFGSMIMLISCWAVMTACAFLFLEVNLWLPPNTNLISMAGATLGRTGQIITWGVYLLLLYSILSAYIAGGGDLFHYVLAAGGIPLSSHLSIILFTLILGFIVYLGIRSVDYVNRGLMFGKLGAFLLLVLFILPFITPQHLHAGDLKHFFAPTGISVTAVAFGSLVIIPSLRTYFGDDVKNLRRAIFIGTLIPLFCYIIWDMVIMGIIPLDNEGSVTGLKQIMHSTNANSDLVATLTSLLKRDTVTVLTKFFTAICMVTSFLSVSLSLSDFLADGFRIPKKGLWNLAVFGATFLPPLVIVLFYPGLFIRGLTYAGIGCFILMVLWPPLMAWRGRYHQLIPARIDDQGLSSYQVGGGRILLGALLIFGTIMVGLGIEGVI